MASVAPLVPVLVAWVVWVAMFIREWRRGWKKLPPGWLIVSSAVAIAVSFIWIVVEAL